MATPTTPVTRSISSITPFIRSPAVTRDEIEGMQREVESVMDTIDNEANGPGEQGRRQDTGMACSMIATLLDIVERQQAELEKHRAKPIVGSFP